jgi:hypothetical protein
MESFVDGPIDSGQPVATNLVRSRTPGFTVMARTTSSGRDPVTRLNR